MTIVAETFLTFDAIGLREDLTDTIYDISPTDTPFMSGSARGSASATLHEWQTDTLESVDGSNAHLEGDDIATFPAIVPTVRVGNYTQISRKLVLIAGTLDTVDKAGRATEMAYQLAKRSKELKRDMETIALANAIGVAGDATTARVSAGLGAWVKTNTDFGATGSDPTYTSGVPNDARNDGTPRAFTEVILKSVIEQVWDSGGELVNLMLGSFNKQAMSAFTGVATKTFNRDAEVPTAVIAAADVYVSDFGVLSVFANRFQRGKDGWVWNPAFTSFNFLRPFKSTPLATTGDAQKRMLIVEWTLKVRNEAALGLCADLTTV